MPDISPPLPPPPDARALTSAPADHLAPDFDEAAYLRAYPDVAAAVQRGELTSGLEHYLLAGKAERRLDLPQYRQSSVPPFRATAEPRGGAARGRGPGAGVDTLMVSESGAVFLSGWTDDRQNPLVTMNLRIGQVARCTWTKFPRLRRRDVEESLRFAGSYQHGFWVFAGSDDRPGPRLSPREVGCTLELCYSNGAAAELNRVPVLVTDTEMRDIVMRYFAACEYLGNPAIEACISLDGGAGDAFIAFNRALSRGFALQALVERFGPAQRKPQVSIVVVLHGIGDYLFLQSSIYAHSLDIEACEFIYVVNSPELTERLHNELRIAQMIYGLSQTLVTLPGNAGLGVASNVGAQFARADRLLFLKPEVFPCDPRWARRHLDVLANLPAEQTRLFGSSLYYDDGTLMHGGMYFEADACFHGTSDGMTRRNMLRVENYGNGAPPWATQYVASRAVPAVAGAFLSVDRAWFERLGGFTEDYVFGHYEDADLCLKSLRRGTPAWLHDIRMFYLAGKDSQRVAQQQGGFLVNRWRFERAWIPTIVPGLLGRAPDLTLFRKDIDTPTMQENDPDVNSNDAVRAPSVRPRIARPNGPLPVRPTKQRVTNRNVTAAVGAPMQAAAKPSNATPMPRAKQRATKPNVAAPVARTKQRAGRPNDAASAAPTQRPDNKPNGAASVGSAKQRAVKPNNAARATPRATKPHSTPPAARTTQRVLTPAPASTRPAARRAR